MKVDEQELRRSSSELGYLLGDKRDRSLSPMTSKSKKRRASPIHCLKQRRSSDVMVPSAESTEVYRLMKKDWNEPKTPTKANTKKLIEPFLRTRSLPIIITSAEHDFFDEDLVQPDRSVKDLRFHYGRSFVGLISLYLKTVDINLKDLDSLAKDIYRDEVNLRMLPGCLSRPSSPIAKVLRVCKSITADDSKRHFSNEWYRVIYVMVTYLINGNRYSYKQIFRRSAVKRQVELLEAEILSRIKREERPLVSQECVLRTSSDITNILGEYDIGAIANVLIRILKINGPLFPEKLHYLFKQLIKPGVDFTPKHEGSMTLQCRDLRLLLQLTPSNHLDYIYRPLGHLLALVTEDPICEVNPEGTGVLFGPTFMVSDNAPITDLQDERNYHIVRLLVEISRSDMPMEGSNELQPFRLPKLFLLDCQKNIDNLQIEASPEMECSFHYQGRCSLESLSANSFPSSSKRKLFDWSSTTDFLKSSKSKLQLPSFLIDATTMDSPQNTPNNHFISPLSFQVKRNTFGQGPLKSHQKERKSKEKQCLG
ncbi:hypothetical protein Aperf_G00000077750 [Anoplocephala perfoliata]